MGLRKQACAEASCLSLAHCSYIHAPPHRSIPVPAAFISEETKHRRKLERPLPVRLSALSLSVSPPFLLSVCSHFYLPHRYLASITRTVVMLFPLTTVFPAVSFIFLASRIPPSPLPTMHGLNPPSPLFLVVNTTVAAVVTCGKRQSASELASKRGSLSLCFSSDCSRSSVRSCSWRAG